LYLWHWPIQVFQATQNILLPDRYPTWVAKLAVIVVSILVAAVSWRFIEQPFRHGRLSVHVPLFAINGALFGVLVCFSMWVLHYGGWPPPSAPQSAVYRDFLRVSPTPEQIRWMSCYVDPVDFPAHYLKSSCLADDPARKHYLLIGDSHAAHFYWGFQKTFPEWNVSEMAVTGCAPTRTHAASKHGACDASSAFMFDDYLAHHPVDTVVLIGRWLDWDVDHLQETTDWIKQHGMNVVVIGPSIEYDASLVRLLELAAREHDPGLPARHRMLDVEQTDKTMQRLAREQWHVPYVSMYEDLCNPQVTAGVASAAGCPVYGAPGTALLWDTDHFGPAGATLLAKQIRDRDQLP
jgi:hypothetical protein